MQPDNEYVHHYIGYMLMKMNNYDGALAEYNLNK